MIEIIAYRPDVKSAKLEAILSRGGAIPPEVEATVREVAEAVRTRGDAAVAEFTERYDGVRLTPGQFRVSAAEIEEARTQVEEGLLQALKEAADNIRRFHEPQRIHSYFMNDGDGVILGKRVVPIQRVGVYVPRGLVSTLLMNVVPAQVAGVCQICLMTPVGKEGAVDPVMLASVGMLGVHEVYHLGGAQAIAAMAYGTETIPKVDKIVGPGNLYIVAAKRHVFGTVGIEMLPGPSEIVVLADDSADPRHVAADLLSQAEHGTGFEASVCITPSEALAQGARDEVVRQTQRMPRAGAIQRALDNFGAIVVVPNLDAGVDLVNRIAPEHVELLVAHPWEWLDRIENAGAVFLGPASSEPVGDYFAGTNHVLPTNGAARFASSLGVGDFLKTISIVAYTQQRLAKTADRIVRLAEAEGLDAHAAAIRMRFSPIKPQNLTTEGVLKEVLGVINAENFDPILRDRILEWTEESFILFLHRNAKKIAKKFRHLQNIEEQRDIGLELFVARIFLLSGCRVVYEPKPARPDFLIKFDTDRFYCEVKRFREKESILLSNQPQEIKFPEKQFLTIGDMICDKLFQLEMGHPNIIYIRSNRFTIQKFDLEKALDNLYRIARSEDPTFFLGMGFEDKRDYFEKKGFKDEQEFLIRASACSAVVLEDFWEDSDIPGATAKIIPNPEAQVVLSSQICEVIKKAVAIPFTRTVG